MGNEKAVGKSDRLDQEGNHAGALVGFPGDFISVLASQHYSRAKNQEGRIDSGNQGQIRQGNGAGNP